MPLTALQARLLSALRQQLEAGPANFRALARQFGVHPVTLREHLDAVARKGYLEIKSQGRGLSPVVTLLRSGVPVVGQIAAGSLTEALELPEGYLKLAPYPGRFGLRVQGDSMADLIQEGDVVLLRKRAPKSGEICALRIDQSEATLKYLEPYPVHPGMLLLRPHNPAYPSLEVEAKRVVVDGVFAGLLRGEVIAELLQGGSEIN